MPLLPPALTTSILGGFAAPDVQILGVTSVQIANGFALGFVPYFLAANIVSTSDVGTAGVGVGVGAGIPIIETALVDDLVSGANSLLLAGKETPQFMKGIARGLSIFMQTSIIQTAHPGVAAGTGVGQILGLEPNSMGAAIFAGFSSQGILGTKTLDLSTAIAIGIAKNFSSLTVNVAIAGTPIVPPAPAPPGAKGFGKIL